MREKPGSFLVAIVDHLTSAVGYAVIVVCLGWNGVGTSTRTTSGSVGNQS